MMRNIFITGRIHNVSDTPLTIIQRQVQEDLDKLAGGHHMDFRISQISGNEYELFFFRSCNYHDIMRTNLVWDVDAAIITGLGLDGFELPEMWAEPPFGIYTYFFEKSEFIRCYQKSAKILGANRIGNLQMDADYEKVVVKLVY